MLWDDQLSKPYTSAVALEVACPIIVIVSVAVTSSSSVSGCRVIVIVMCDLLPPTLDFF